MKGEIVCLDLGALYDLCTDNVLHDEVELYFCYSIRRTESDVGYYYDLINGIGLRICCDGEQCKILEQTDSFVRLIDVEDIDNEELEGLDTSFKLSIGEFKTATHTDN